MTDHHVQNPGDDAGGLATPAPDPVGDPPPDLTLRMRSSPRLLAGARELIASLARRLGFDEVSACQVALAVDEALANVIRHGYERREDGPIDMFELDVADQDANDDADTVDASFEDTDDDVTESGDGLVEVAIDKARAQELVDACKSFGLSSNTSIQIRGGKCRARVSADIAEQMNERFAGVRSAS